MFSAHLGPDSQTAWFYQSQASEDMAGQEPVVPQGKILGGSSSINHMMLALLCVHSGVGRLIDVLIFGRYSRPQKSDLDGFNAEGWGYEDLLPLFKKVCHLLVILLVIFSFFILIRARSKHFILPVPPLTNRFMALMGPFKSLMVGSEHQRWRVSCYVRRSLWDMRRRRICMISSLSMRLRRSIDMSALRGVSV
jgi:hypothetical protein